MCSYGSVSVTADGTDSVVDISSLVTFQDFDTSERSRLAARNGGAVLAGSLVDVRGVELVLNGTGTLPIAQLVSLTDGAVTLSGQDYAFLGLQNAAGTVVHDQRGARGPQRRDQLDPRRGDALARRDGRSEPEPGASTGPASGSTMG